MTTTATKPPAPSPGGRVVRSPRFSAWMMTLGFTVLSLALAFWQKPGWSTADTKIDLHVDPGRFLSFVASVWTPTTDLGEVHSAQYSGYLWPMGPFFAVLHGIGISDWVVERVWLGLLFALSAWGVIRLMDVLVGRRRGLVHAVAAGFYLLNPYVVVFTARTSFTLLGYAALPWLLVIAHHGLRATHGWRGWRPWWWAAAFALVMNSTGGGVNAAVLAWMLVGPLVLLIYEPAIGAVRWRDSIGFLLRIAVLGVLAGLWWIAPLLVHVRFGIDFLQFTEQPFTIWGTNSLTESLRLMGYWTSYLGVGFGVTRPYFSDGGTLLFNPLVVGASLLLPALAIVGFVRARRLSYAPFLLLLVIVGVIIETAGFPNGTPVRGTMLWIYQHVFVLRFLRTTNKAAPLVALGLAGLLGLGARQAITYLRARPRRPWRTASLVAAPTALVALLVLASLPLIQGKALDSQQAFKRIPAAWTQVGRSLDRVLPANTRALILPGQIFAYYDWGGTLDAILPRLTKRPVAVRYETPYSDLHAVDLLTTVDDLVQQRRLVPGQLMPLLRLMGVGSVVSGSDDDISRSGAVGPAAAAVALAAQGLGRPVQSYGPVRRVPAADGDIGAGVNLPEVRRYATGGSRGIVHVDPAGPATVVDGSAQTLADLAAFGALPSRQPILYAGDLGPRAVRNAAGSGSNLVVGDSNRRRQFLPESTQQNRSATLTVTDPVPAGVAIVNPFAPAGTNGQTVAVLQGARYLHAPWGPGELQFPENTPIAAFDGNLATPWIADRNLPVLDRWIEVGFNRPRDVPYVDVYPFNDAHGTVREVDVNGIHHSVGPGWTRIPVHLHGVSALRVTIDKLQQPKVLLGGAGGFREIRIPGFHVRQLLRPPVVLGRDLAGANLGRDSLSYVFERTTGDDPFRRNAFGDNTLQDNPQDRGDAEAQIDRLVFAPAARRYAATAWVYPAVTAPDSALDALAGYRGPDRFESSSRFQNQPRYRASSAFTRDSPSGWAGLWNRPEAPLPWLSWSSPRALRLSHLTLGASHLPVRRPTSVQISWPGGTTRALPVGVSGGVQLPHPVTARTFRLTVLTAAWPAGAGTSQSRARAVGIGSVSGPGLPAANIPATGRLHVRCGTVAIQVGDRRIPLEPSGTVAQLNAGVPLQARTCQPGLPVAFGAGVQEIRTLPGPFSVDLLKLTSPALTPAPPPVSGGSVANPGTIGTSSVNGVRVALRGPSWVVLGESFDQGWRATCNGRALGAPRVIDGYANGWLAPANCTQVAFTFAPQSGVKTSYVVSAVAVAAMLLLLILGALRHPVPAAVDPRRLLPDVSSGPRPLWRAAAIALVMAIPLGYLFAIRAGAGLFLLLTFVLWRGYGPRTLVLAAAALLGIVVPILYAIVSPSHRGPYDFAYSTQLITPHWVGVGAIVLLIVAVGQIMRRSARGPDHDTRPR